jgi:hypothetical protein
MRPANGALAMDASDMGASTRPACRGLSDRMDCRKITNGRKSPSMPKEMAATTPLMTAKLRSA